VSADRAYTVCTALVRTEIWKDEIIMAAAEKDLKKDRLYLRVSPRQREVISEAAEASQKDLSAFVLEAAIVQAQRVLADRRIFKLDKARWERFNQALDRPVVKPTAKAKLSDLLREPSILETPTRSR
jgi:uncharacterized protein (DUF1778 family)